MLNGAGARSFFVGATVSAGSLLVATGGSIASSASTVANGGTLIANGTAGSVVVNSGGSLGGSGTPALDFCQRNEADLLILDLQLPDGLGLSVLKTAVRKNRKVNGIVLSGHASEFVCPTDLRPNLRAVVDKTQAYGTLQKEIAEIVRPFASSVAHANPWDLLTERERQIYSMVGQGRMSKEIAEDLRIAVRTVETHRKAICRKLKVSGPELIRQAAINLQTNLPS